MPQFHDADGGAELDLRNSLQEMTDAIQANDESAFLTHFAGRAHESAWYWWQNMTALGMDGGAVGVGWGWPTSARLRSGQGGLFGVELGGHLPGDETDSDGLPIVSTTTYYWVVEATDQYPQPTVVDWVSVERAPWDCRCLLHVTNGPGGVVASFPDERYLAENQQRNLTQAYEWSQYFWKAFGPEGDSLAQPVVAFVTAKKERLLEWFTDVDQTDPPEEVNFSAQTWLLDRYQGPDRDVSGKVAGAGARIVLNDAPPDDVAVLVHELTHYYLARYVNDYSLFQDNLYAVEGVAELTLNVYRATELEDAKAGSWKVDLWENNHEFDVRKDFADLFEDDVPTREELFGDDGVFWYTVSASVFAYLADEYGYKAAVAAGICSQTFNHSTFDCVANPDSSEPGTGRPGTNTSWLEEKDIRAGWLKWVAKTYG